MDDLIRRNREGRNRYHLLRLCSLVESFARQAEACARMRPARASAEFANLITEARTAVAAVWLHLNEDPADAQESSN